LFARSAQANAAINGNRPATVPAVSEGPPMSEQPDPGGTKREGRSAWHWLLLIPLVVPLITVLYNGKNPYFLGFPRFYWLQLAFILLGVGTTTFVYQKTKDRGDRS